VMGRRFEVTEKASHMPSPGDITLTRRVSARPYLG
jgi:hypothetical protein